MLATEQIEVIQNTSQEQIGLPTLLGGKGLVVEFVGPTGCGKTTNCNYLNDQLKKDGFHVLLFSDVKKHFWGQSAFNKIRIVALSLRRHTPQLFHFVILLMKYGIFNSDSLWRYIRLCVFHTVLEETKKKENPDIILLDQWIIQGLWSAIILNAHQSQPEPEEIKKFLFDSGLIIYFDVDATTANERIKTRDFGDSRFDTMEEAKRLSALKKYSNDLFWLFFQSNCKNKWIFSANDHPKENASKFLWLLKKVLNKNQHQPWSYSV